MVALGWLVLGLVFLDERAGRSASTGGRPLAAVCVRLARVPRLRSGGGPPFVVFGLASWGLWAAGHHSWAVALLVFSDVVNGLAQLPSIRDLAEVSETGPPASR